MTRLITILYPLLVLFGCQFSSARELQIATRLEQSGDGTGACNARRRAAEAMRREGDQFYVIETAAANSYCLAQGIE